MAEKTYTLTASELRSVIVGAHAAGKMGEPEERVIRLLENSLKIADQSDTNACPDGGTCYHPGGSDGCSGFQQGSMGCAYQTAL